MTFVFQELSPGRLAPLFGNDAIVYIDVHKAVHGGFAARIERN
ncbi:MAG: hypothetical protein Q7T68_15515 [Sphingopyxis sp.]|nr:hypothetical protein [Sphingopyxis sp.]